MASRSRKSPPRKRPSPPPAPKRGRGRPKGPAVKIDIKQLRSLAGIFCTRAEAANVLGISVDTLERRFKESEEIKAAWEEGRGTGKASLRRNQFRLSEKNATMAIFLGKQELGQRERELDDRGGGMVWDAAALAKLSSKDLDALEGILDRFGIAIPGSDSGGTPET